MDYLISSDTEIKLIPVSDQVKPTGKIFPHGHFTWEEVLNVKDKDWKEYFVHIKNIILLVAMLEELRKELGKSISIESWFRSIWYNDVDLPSRGYASSTTSDHKQGRAVDTNIKPINDNINAWKKICNRHNVYWSYGLYNDWMHLGFRFDKNNNWDYR